MAVQASSLSPLTSEKSSVYHTAIWSNHSEELKWAGGPDIKIALLSNLTDHRFRQISFNAYGQAEEIGMWRGHLGFVGVSIH
jgi:hypothetical protein